MVISILNFCNGCIDVINVKSIEEDTIDNVEDYLESLGYNPDQISFMVTDDFQLNTKIV